MVISPFWGFITTTQQWAFIPKQEEIRSNYYRPIKSLSYSITYQLFGLNAWGFHLTNIILNSLVPILVFLISLKLLNNVLYSLVASVIFAVHPIHTEVVAWIASVQEVIFSLFYLTSFYIHINISKDRSIYFYTSGLLFLFALLSKETAITLPVILIFFDYIYNKVTIRRYIPYFFAIIIYLSMRMYALGGLIPQITRVDINNYHIFMTLSPIIIKYITKLFLPLNLNMYNMFEPYLYFNLVSILSLIILILVSFIILINLKKKKKWTLYCLWIPITLFPVLYFKGLGGPIFAERYLYLPSVGFCMLIGNILLETEALKRTGEKILLLIIILLFSYQTINRNKDWIDEITLYKKTVIQSPLSSAMHYNLANAYQQKGFLFIGKAANEYQEALKIEPDMYDAHVSLGNIYKNKGMFDKAIKEYEYALKLIPNHAGININLGIVYQKVGRIDDAIDRFKDAVMATPDYSDAHYNLARGYQQKGIIVDAIKEYNEAIRTNISNTDAYYNLADLYYNNGDSEGALKIYKDLLHFDKLQLPAYIKIGDIYQNKGMFDKALEVYNEAFKINPNSRNLETKINNVKRLKELNRKDIGS